MSESIGTRKDEHLDIVLQQAVEHRGSSLLECVDLIHQSLPELDLAEVESAGRLFGRSVTVPLLITGMTGGTDRAGRINRDLALAAQAAGVPMGVGSMRPLLADGARREDYDLRGQAPDIPLLGNLGVMQAADLPADEAGDILRELGFDALCIHLNPAQELAQREGDRTFRGAIDTIARYVDGLGLPVVVKETGAGLSTSALDAIRSCSVEWVDVSGRGGTSWTKVEGFRPEADAFGHMFGDWGIPTAVSLCWAQDRGFRTIASGGIRSVLDVLRALVLGARVVGFARPVLEAVDQGGVEAATRMLVDWTEVLRRGMLLVGAADLASLRTVPRVLHRPLTAWIEQGARP